ncbi:MAG: ABC transporter permease [Victivallaceae bacterium]|nr:ABC transporter permease [Victivallaceae bacterium]
MLQTFLNVWRLGIKELRGLLRDPLLIGLIIYAFTLGVYISSTATPDTLNRTTIAIVDEDNSQLSGRLTDAFLPPYFVKPEPLKLHEIDNALDRGTYTFVIVIPRNFQRDVIYGRATDIQLNVDATRMSQAFIGNGHIQQIIQQEIQKYYHASSPPAASVVVRNRFNPNLTRAWFGSVVQLIDDITMLAIILTGAALIRERENGTLEHLLVMPVTAFEIMLSKVWSMALIVLLATGISLFVVIKEILGVPIEGSAGLFFVGVALHLFAVTSLGIFLACIARNMPQLGIMIILILIPMQLLSGGVTPRESMPQLVQFVMQAAPTTHLVEFSQAILYRGAGLRVAAVSFAKLFIIGAVLFFVSLVRFRKTMVQS